MALGSSAPEILLATLEAVTNLGKPAGSLGAGTIVGSAAFNLLVILSVCVISPPTGQTRKIADFGVFLITAVASVFAYVWFAIVLLVWTPKQVTLWEAIITFMMFPVLLFLAWGQDNSWWRKKPATVDEENSQVSDAVDDGNVTDLEDDVEVELKEHSRRLRRLVNEMREKGVPNGVDPEEYKRSMAKALVHDMIEKKTAQAQAANSLLYRINGARTLTGRARVLPVEVTDDEEEFYNHVFDVIGEVVDSQIDESMPIPDTVAMFDFEASKYRFLESSKRATVVVKRRGNTSGTVAVGYKTVEGTATSPADFAAKEGYLVFQPHEMEKALVIDIVDDDEYEKDEFFFVHLLPLDDVGVPSHEERKAQQKVVESDSEDDGAGAASQVPNAVKVEPLPDNLTDGIRLEIGERSSCRVVIVNDDAPSVIAFEAPEVECIEGCGLVRIPVIRTGGTDGELTVQYKTMDDTAKAEEDYVAKQGEVKFVDGEARKEIEIQIVDDEVQEEDEWFFVKLSKPSTATAVLGNKKVKVIIHDDDDIHQIRDKVKIMVERRASRFALATSSWRAQFTDALIVGGDADEAGNDISPSTSDYVMHFLTTPWKVLFALVPPTNYYGGWVTFVVALMFIGGVTALVDVVARSFGCIVGLKESVNAITMVALGTSLPDTFASRQAAKRSPTADASITNVTGSNSVNVFLGLGLPWLISAIYWTAQGDVYSVPAEGLSLGVIVFTVCAVICLGLLIVRRFVVGGELGGGSLGRWLTAALFSSMWILFIVLSALQAYGVIEG
jgi:solute carrier family 8 (sodium/calcium exchanger)